MLVHQSYFKFNGNNALNINYLWKYLSYIGEWTNYLYQCQGVAMRQRRDSFFKRINTNK